MAAKGGGGKGGGQKFTPADLQALLESVNSEGVAKTFDQINALAEDLVERFPKLDKAVYKITTSMDKAQAALEEYSESMYSDKDMLEKSAKIQEKVLDELEKAYQAELNSRHKASDQAKNLSKAFEEAAEALATDARELKRDMRARAKARKESLYSVTTTVGTRTGRAALAEALGGSEELVKATGKGGKTLAQYGLKQLAEEGGPLAKSVASLGEATKKTGFLGDMLGGGGMAGGLAAAGITAIGVAMDETTKKATEGTLRFLNYGKAGVNTGIGLSGLTDELREQGDAYTSAALAVGKYNGDIEATRAATVKLATETGASWKDVADNVGEMEKLRFIGLGTIDEVNDYTIKRMNETGKSMKDSLAEMNDIAMDAQAIKENTTGNTVISMHDFFKAVQEVREAIGSMTTNQRDLSKTMALGAITAGNLGMSYDKIVKASKGVGLALTANYDEGYATIEAQDDLQIALKATSDTFAQAQKKKADLEAKGASQSELRAAQEEVQAAQLQKEQAEYIKAQEASGAYTPADEARRIKETGLNTLLPVLNAKLTRAAQTGGPLALKEARFGALDFDTERTLNAMMERQRANPEMTLEKQIAELKPADRTAFLQKLNAAAAQQTSTTKLADVTLAMLIQQLTNMLQEVVSPLKDVLGLMVDLLSKIAGVDTPAQKAAKEAQAKRDAQASDAMTEASDAIAAAAPLAVGYTQAYRTAAVTTLNTGGSAAARSAIENLGGEDTINATAEALLRSSLGSKVANLSTDELKARLPTLLSDQNTMQDLLRRETPQEADTIKAWMEAATKAGTAPVPGAPGGPGAVPGTNPLLAAAGLGGPATIFDAQAHADSGFMMSLYVPPGALSPVLNQYRTNMLATNPLGLSSTGA